MNSPQGNPARYGAVAAPHHLATEAGEDAFRSGGNAIDAALAAAAVLTVVYPNNVAIGSDLVALVRSPDGEIRCFNATGYAPAAHNVERLREKYGTELPLRGVDTITVPGGVGGWKALHAHGAKLDWSSIFHAPIRHATKGVPLARSVAAAIIEDESDLRGDPGCRALFFPNGIALKETELLRQPNLAQSLTELQSGGAEALYGGSLGKRLIAGMAQLGSVMSLADLAEYEPEIMAPLRSTFRDYEVISSPPNTQGFMLLRALARVQQLGDPAEILDAGVGALGRIFEQANAVRNTMLADPRFARVDIAELMGIELTEETGTTGSPRAAGDTVGVSTVDSDGYAVSLIQSVFHAFGSTILEPGTGILLQNRGTSFSLNPASPNVVEPRKRPRHTLMPVLVTRDNDIRWVSSTMGGQGQPQVHAQLLLRSLGGADALSAVTAPRWMVGVSEAGDTDETVYVEADSSPAVTASLTANGLNVKIVPPHSESLGHANLIRVDENGRFDAASDPRADGSAIEIELPA